MTNISQYLESKCTNDKPDTSNVFKIDQYEKLAKNTRLALSKSILTI